MIPETMRKPILEAMGLTDTAPANYFLKVGLLLKLAPVEEWKSLMVQLDAGKATDARLGKCAEIQRFQARELAILAFAAQQIDQLSQDADPSLFERFLEEMTERAMEQPAPSR